MFLQDAACQILLKSVNVSVIQQIKRLIDVLRNTVYFNCLTGVLLVPLHLVHLSLVHLHTKLTPNLNKLCLFNLV